MKNVGLKLAPILSNDKFVSMRDVGSFTTKSVLSKGGQQSDLNLTIGKQSTMSNNPL